MTGDGTPAVQRSSPDPARTRRPGLLGGILLVFAVVLVAVAGLCFSGAGADGALVGPALVATLLAVVSLLLAALSFQLARQSGNPRALTGPALLFTILVLAVGVVGAGIALVLSLIAASTYGIAASGALLPIALLLAALGSLVHGTAKQQPRP